MKQRTGFVSNSSSSSFCICSKEDLTIEMYDRAVGVIPGTIAHSVLSDHYKRSPTYSSIAEFLDNFGIDDEKQFEEEYSHDDQLAIIYKYLKMGWKVYESSFERGGDFGDATWTTGETGVKDVKLFKFEE